MKKHITLTALTLCLALLGAVAQTRETRNVETFTKISFRIAGTLHLRQGSPQKVEVEGPKDAIKDIETKVDDGKLIIGKENSWVSLSWGEDDINVYITVQNLEGLGVSGSGKVIGETKFTTGDLDLKVSGSGELQLEADASGDVEADVSGSGEIDLKGKCKSINSDVSGSGKVMASVTITDKADFNVSGSGKIMARGTANQMKAGISGSGKVLAADLIVNRCEVRISGSGDVEIHVKDELDATISGSGSVLYKGDPKRVNGNSSGSGKVSKM